MSYLKINQNYFNKFQIIKIKYEILKINAHVVEPNTVFFLMVVPSVRADGGPVWNFWPIIEKYRWSFL